MNTYNKIKSVLNRFLEVQASDPDDARQRRILNIILTLIGLLGLVASILALVLVVTEIITPQEFTDILMASFSMFVGSILTYLMNRYGSGVIAGTVFILLVMFAIFFADTSYELSNGRSVYLFLLPIIISSFLLGSRYTFLFYILSSIELGTVSLIAGKQIYEPIFAYVTFFIVAFISWLSSRSLEQALRDLRATNLNLDKLVEQKTEELSATLSRELILAGRNQTILDSIADGVIVFDAEGISILVNPALSQILEKPIKDLQGIDLADFIKTTELSPENRETIMVMIEHPHTVGRSIQVEWGKKTLAINVARVRNSETYQNIGAVAVIRDVTHEAELEKMKSSFVAVVSHELRTPLNAIMGYAEILKEAVYGPINEKQVMVTERIIVNTQRLLAMVGDLLDEARIKAGKLSLTHQSFKTSSLLETMHATMDKITADKLLYLTDEFDPNMPEEIIGDASRLQQILINLVNNSAKFTDKGGIHVHIFCNDPNHWTMEVTDTGQGIPEEELPYIFESFRQVENSTTRTYGGFGLGLSIVKQLVELMQGEVVVSSELGKGSTFIIKLPLEDNL
jgi:PAS domain S-box-containing protein